ncbi:MAG: hypothetical protein IPN90_10395 [Elusimicrobia bacterium]|nr:hypothetical protein [Elusimicrobiota bacterium]
MNIARAFIISLVLTVGGVCGVWADDVYMMGRAIETWDRALLGEALRGVEADAKSHPDDVRLAYWHCVGAFHTVLMDKPSDEGVASVLETVRAANRLDPEQKEIQAMLCVLYGMRIHHNKLRAVWLGPRVMSFGKSALAPPENPRALYLAATCRFYGGRGKKDFEEALRLLERADVLFVEESQLPPSATEPRWGRAGCLRFIKLVSEKLDRDLKP